MRKLIRLVLLYILSNRHIVGNPLSPVDIYHINCMFVRLHMDGTQTLYTKFSTSTNCKIFTIS